MDADLTQDSYKHVEHLGEQVWEEEIPAMSESVRSVFNPPPCLVSRSTVAPECRPSHREGAQDNATEEKVGLSTIRQP